MKYWLDTEFIEDGRTIDLLSIGIVAEDGREFYAQPDGADWRKASEWVLANVAPHLQPTYQPRADVRAEVMAFCDPKKFGKPEFWGYYADYDWVALCQLFGTMMDLPKGWPMYCRDIKQLCDDKGNPPLPEQGKGEHHALADAKWNKQAWEFLQALSPGGENKRLAELAETRRRDNHRLAQAAHHVLDGLNEFHHDGCLVTMGVAEWAHALDVEVALHTEQNEPWTAII